MRPGVLFWRAILFSALLVMILPLAVPCATARSPRPSLDGASYLAYLPLIGAASPPAPSGSPPPGVAWDPRLDLRMAKLIPANVGAGQGYWKLVEGVWFDVGDTLPMGLGDHDIGGDVQDSDGARQLNKMLKVTWLGGEGSLYTQDKLGEKYASNYPMYHIAPTYNIRVDDGFSSDEVDGLGMGTIQNPGQTIHTSYGFIWRWTIAANAILPPTATPTTGPTATPTPPVPPTPVPGSLTWDPQLDQLNAVLVPALVTSGQGYWRLVKGTWYDVNQGPFPNYSLILVDTLDGYGTRKTGVPIAVSVNDGSALIATLQTEAKPGELYATSFQMTELRPMYRVRPADGAPADMVYNLGQGSITQPYSKLATSYGFAWQWTIAP